MTLSLLSPRLIAPQSVPVLRWGVIGTSIGDSFVQAVHAHTPQRVVAVAARDRDRHRSHGSRPFPRRSPIPSGAPTWTPATNWSSGWLPTSALMPS